ncbi:MAG: hypothetical protein HYV63_12920 [Candidatus Schekmanbacteria bacterium]|nr:hypothetical protein [Candidatus Schekmanbacteria bacterium]
MRSKFRFPVAWVAVGLCAALASCGEGPSTRAVRQAISTSLQGGRAPQWACGIVFEQGQYAIDFAAIDIVERLPFDAKAQAWPVKAHLTGTCEPKLFQVGERRSVTRTSFDHEQMFHVIEDANGDWAARPR